MKHAIKKHEIITFNTILNSSSDFKVEKKINEMIGINSSLGIPSIGFIETFLFTISPEPSVWETIDSEKTKDQIHKNIVK